MFLAPSPGGSQACGWMKGYILITGILVPSDPGLTVPWYKLKVAMLLFPKSVRYSLDRSIILLLSVYILYPGVLHIDTSIYHVASSEQRARGSTAELARL